jgi:hypothetical protein
VYFCYLGDIKFSSNIKKIIAENVIPYNRVKNGIEFIYLNNGYLIFESEFKIFQNKNMFKLILQQNKDMIYITEDINLAYLIGDW